MYVSREITLVNYSWQFYALKHGRTGLKSRVTYFDRDLDLAQAPVGSVFLAAFDPEHASVLDQSPALKRIELIENADRHPAFAVYEK